jgi:hypothetical protein
MGERKPRRPRDIAEHLASLTVLKERMGETAYVPIAVGRKPRRSVLALGVRTSLHAPFPKYRRTHSNHRRALCNRDLIVAAHTH